MDDIDHLSKPSCAYSGWTTVCTVRCWSGPVWHVPSVKGWTLGITRCSPPVDLINARTLSSVINHSLNKHSCHSSWIRQTHLSEITHKRRISPSARWFESWACRLWVRDVHYSHYGRLCTIETPEGPNIGLISTLCSRQDQWYGFIETLIIKLDRKVDPRRSPSSVPKKKIQRRSPRPMEMMKRKFVRKDISRAARPATSRSSIKHEVEYGRCAQPDRWFERIADSVPEHDDANRALMGSNMQRQAVPLISPEVPIVVPARSQSCPRCTAFRYMQRRWRWEFVDANEIHVFVQAQRNKKAG